MNEKTTAFLPFFFQEPVYVVPDPSMQRVYTPLGSNRRRILVLVDEAEEEYLAEENQLLLMKILQALTFTLEDICLVNVAQAESPDMVKEEVDFTSCISFGMPPEPWQFSNFFRKYEVMKDESERAFLFADTLAEIREDVEKKKRLWISLKTLFPSA